MNDDEDKNIDQSKQPKIECNGDTIGENGINQVGNEEDEDDDDDNDDDDDDDLIAYDLLKKPRKTVTQVLTPRKGIKPIDDEDTANLPAIDSPLQIKPSTTTSSGSSSRGGKGKPQFSLSYLLKEKLDHDVMTEKEKQIDKMETAGFTPLPIDDEDDEEKLSNSPHKTFDEEHSQDFSQTLMNDSRNRDSDDDENSEYNRDDENSDGDEEGSGKPKTFITDDVCQDFPDTFPGRELFTRPASSLNVAEVLRELLKSMLDEGENEELTETTEEEMNEMLFQIIDSSIGVDNSLEKDVCDQIWQIMCSSEDMLVSQIANQFLTSMILQSKVQEKHEESWKLTPTKFLEGLIKLGANPVVVITMPEVKRLEHGSSSLLANGFTPEEEFQDTRSIRKVLHKRLFNIEAMVRLATVYIQTFPLSMTTDELKMMLIIVAYMAVDKLVQLLLWDLTVLVGSILDTYSSPQWTDEVKALCCTLTSLSFHHRDMVHFVECIPPTDRGIPFQQVLACNLAMKLIQNIDEIDEENIIMPPITPEKIYQVLYSIKIKTDTDYWVMFCVLTLIGICSKHDLKPTTKKYEIMESIEEKLTSLNMKINEHMGINKDRTKVKNLIIKLVNRFKYSSNKVQAQSYLDSYFEKTESS